MVVEIYDVYRKVVLKNSASPDLPALFKALSDPTRFAVFQCIRCCGPSCGYDEETGVCCGGEGDEITACRIRCQVPCAPSTLTHHLNELRAVGLITTERRGRVVFCRVRPETLGHIASFISGK